MITLATIAVFLAHGIALLGSHRVTVLPHLVTARVALLVRHRVPFGASLSVLCLALRASGLAVLVGHVVPLFAPPLLHRITLFGGHRIALGLKLGAFGFALLG